MGAAPRRSRWRTPTTGAVALGAIGAAYFAVAVLSFVLTGVSWGHDGQLARGSAAAGGIAAVIALSALAQAAACWRWRAGDRVSPRRLTGLGAWLLGLAAAGVVGLLLLGEAALACVAAGLVVPLPLFFLWLTFGTVRTGSGPDGVH